MQIIRAAGLLMYRLTGGVPEVLLAHPGGPYFKDRDDGVLSVPKGEADEGEQGGELFGVAQREFMEETGFIPHGPYRYLGFTTRSDGKKTVDAWAFQGDGDIAQATSNTVLIEWPPRSGHQLEIPEVDRVAFFDLATAKRKITPYQLALIEAF